MGNSDKVLSEMVDILKSWIPRRAEPENVSRDFWMPDHSCRVCYECDSQFTVFNRKHHCRLCGRIFCGKCTANSVPVLSDDPKSGREETERIRVCNFCFKQWEQEVAATDHGVRVHGAASSPSLSTTSLVSTKSSGTANSTATTICSYPTGPYQHVLYGSSPSPGQSATTETFTDKQDALISRRAMDTRYLSPPTQFGYHMNRSDDDDDVYGLCPSNLEVQSFQHSDDYYGHVDFDEVDQDFHSNEMHPAEENTEPKEICSPSHDNIDFHASLDVDKMEEEAEPLNSYGCDAASIYGMENTDADPVDFENNGLIWLPPDPEDEEDDKEAIQYDDDDEEDASGEWGYLRSSNRCGSDEHRSRDRSNEEHKKAMKIVVDGHFRALIAQLLQVENLPVGEQNDRGSWLEIITSLSWEVATLLKPDTSKGGGMDPGGYVKVKCLACGHRNESMVVKGVVCKKNVAHRRMTSKIETPHFLILGGALEYQRVTNLLSSFDTLLQQEMDHLKMAVAKIGAHHPNVLLVEKSVSRFAQDYLLAKNISLVLNIKRPLLERIARCTGAQIVPSIDHLSSQKLGHCDLFHVEKYVEEHGDTGQGGKKMMKTLMFFEGCPKPLGCTVLLKGAPIDELKKVKHVVQYGVFAAYHLALETSFLADEGASLPELPLKSPITVALPDKPSSIDRSISTVPGFTAPAVGKPQLGCDTQRPYTSDSSLALLNSGKMVKAASLYSSKSSNTQMADSASAFRLSSDTKGFSMEKSNQAEHVVEPTSSASISLSISGVGSVFPPGHRAMKEKNKVCFGESHEAETFRPDGPAIEHDTVVSGSCLGTLETSETWGAMVNDSEIKSSHMVEKQPVSSRLATSCQDIDQQPENTLIKEEFPPHSDHQSILVSLSIRSVWKGTVCEHSHLFRIKYYGNFDKPLGRYLRDHLFDQRYRCHSCDMPSEAHVHCYTHRQGSLTISVRKLPEILLSGERDGKIWMWHRCLRCPRNDGFPPTTHRVAMSDAAWGLSLGKFLELSFSNHAAASRVASCGHSLHRDCLRFYGFGNMVACFRYAPIDLHSVHLPPPKLDFNYEHQEWVQKEANEVSDGAELLFHEILNALSQITESKSMNGSMKVSELRRHFVELTGVLQKEKAEFEDYLHKVLKKESRKGQPVIDILEVNKLKRQLIFYSYLWDQRLISAAGSGGSPDEVLNSFMMRDKEKLTDLNPGPKPQKSFNNSDTFPGDFTNSEFLNGSMNAVNHQEDINDHHTLHSGYQRCIKLDSFQRKQIKTHHSTSTIASEQSVFLETGLIGRRSLSDGQFPDMVNLSDTFDAKWAGENGPFFFDTSLLDLSNSFKAAIAASVSKDSQDRSGAELAQSFASSLPTKLGEMPSLNLYHSYNGNLGSSPRFNALNEYNPVYVPLLQELECQRGARFLLPVGVNDTVIPIYDDEPTSIISYALVSPEYHLQISDEQERTKDGLETSVSLLPYDSGNVHLSWSFDETTSEPYKNFGSIEDSILSLSGSRGSVVLDPLIYTKGMHVKVSFADEGPLGKVKYTVTCYYAKHFDALRRTCCPSEFDFIRSLCHCKKWGAQGGKSNVFFAKSLDDRFIIKQVTKTELESFIKFAPKYFKYLSESIDTRSPTCLAKILGIYQVTSRNLKGGKELKMDVLIMENLFFGRNLTRLYDLKGSSRSRYNPDSSGNNKVLLDQNLIESMPTSPIFVGNKAKRLLERAVWNDTSFLASIDVMDYSLLVGVDEEKHELVLGIIDFMRQYTWDKQLETWVKASGILGGPKNVSPTVVSPKQYKKRFRKAMSAYFLVVPDQWSPPSTVPNESQTDACQDNQEDPSVET